MTWTPPNKALEECREPRCVHLTEYKTEEGPNDWCNHPKRQGCGGRPPMHHPCAWKETEWELRDRAEREGRL